MHGEQLKGEETSEVEGELHGGTGSVPEDIRVSDFLDEDASDAQHSPSGVHAFRFRKVVEALSVSAEAQGVEPVVGREIAGFQICREKKEISNCSRRSQLGVKPIGFRQRNIKQNHIAIVDRESVLRLGCKSLR